MAIEAMEMWDKKHIIEMKVGERWIDLSYALNACKEALEQPAQEPVAYNFEGVLFFANEASHYMKDSGQPLYTHPHQWQGLTDDEIVEKAEKAGFTWHETRHGHKFLIAPAEAEMGDGYFAIESELKIFACAIEQALRIKNDH